MSGRYVHDFTVDDERRLYAEGIAHFNAGDFFEAHDIWEEAWKGTLDKRRERFYRGIIQSAVTLELLRRGRAIGVRQVFVTCAELLEGVPPIFMGLDVARHLAQVRHAIEPALSDLDMTGMRVDPSRLFQIELLYDPFTDSRHGEGVDGRAG